VTVVLVAAAGLVVAALGVALFLLRRDARGQDMESVGARVDRALWLGSLPDPCAGGHGELTYQFAERRAGSGAPVVVFEEAFCSVCTAPAPTPPWRDCRECLAVITSGGLGLQFELEPCRRHVRFTRWDGKRWGG